MVACNAREQPLFFNKMIDYEMMMVMVMMDLFAEKQRAQERAKREQSSKRVPSFFFNGGSINLTD